MIKIVVASESPAKYNTVRAGFADVFHDELEICPIAVDSGIADQPLDDEQTLTGAKNRAQKAREIIPIADYWVGIEGGVEEIGEQAMSFSWIAVLSAHNLGLAKTPSYMLPTQVVRLLKQGIELGEANDHIFGRKNSKHSEGASGILTRGIIDRVALYKPTVILALIPSLNQSLYT